MGLDVLFFEVRGTRCALPVSVVREVLVTPHVTPVPLAPPPLRGLVPVHGQVLPLLDVGPALVPGSEAGVGTTMMSLRPYGEQIVVVETELPGLLSADDEDREAGGGGDRATSTAVRAALVASRVMRLGTIEDGHSWRPPPGPAFVRATVLDADGPALLLDAGRAMEQLRTFLDRAVHGERAAPQAASRAQPAARAVRA